jgi:magnesium transporter
MSEENKTPTDLEDQSIQNKKDILSQDWEESIVLSLTDDKIENIIKSFSEETAEEPIALFQELRTPDQAEVLEKVNQEIRQQILDEHGQQIDPLVYAELDPELRKSALESMTPSTVAAIISELDSDDALDLILNLENDFQQSCIKHLSAKTRLTLQEGLNFPEDSAGRLMQREFVAIPQFWTVGKTIDFLRAATDELPQEFFDLFVITPSYHVVGEIPLNKIIRAKRSEKLDQLSLDEIHPIPATLDQEEVAEIFRRDNLTSAPVVDEHNRLIGVITIDDVVDVIDEEAHEDFLRLAGVESGDLYRAVFSTGASRFRWLFVNLLTAILASLVISLFDATIDEIVALAILMPIVASMGGNAGTQALTVAVRALATRDLSKTNAIRIIWKESLVGTLNGIAFAIIMGIITTLWFSNPILGSIIAAAMIINLIVAGFFGASIPIVLERMGSDPAISSTVFLTTVTDVIGFLAFLGLAAVYLV